MDTENVVLSTWSYGLAGLVYSIFALSLLRRGYLRAPREAARVTLVLAVLGSAVWGCLLIAFLSSGQQLLLRIGYLADVLRYAGWFVFLLALLRLRRQEVVSTGMAWLVPATVFVLAVAMLAQAFFGVWSGCIGTGAQTGTVQFHGFAGDGAGLA